jgi:hypothetical protein
VAVWLAILTSLAAALVGLGSSPAQAAPSWEPYPLYLKTAWGGDGKCLQLAGATGVLMGPCNASSAGNKWEMGINQKVPNTLRFRLRGTNQCLDSNNVEVYLTPCDREWIGQYWNAGSTGGHVLMYGNDRSKLLTAWNEGRVSMASPGSSGSDTQLKQLWQYDWIR